MEQTPRKTKTPRQENTIIRLSASKGATKKLKLGASSWVAMAFPQCLTLTSAVREASPEGR